MAKIKHFRLNHLYDHYPLYLAIYGQPPHDRARDVREAAIVVHAWVERFMKQPTINLDTGAISRGLRIMELFSGSSSEHEAEFRRALQMPIKEYHLSDLVKHPDTDSRVMVADITGDPTEDLLARKNAYDILLAFYFSAGSFLKESQQDDPYPVLDKMMENAAYMTAPGGLYVLDILQNPVDGCMSALIEGDSDGETERSVGIYSFNPLRKALGLPVVGGYCELVYRLENKVSRTRFLSLDRLFDIRVKFNNVVVARFSVKEPLSQIAFTEGELVRSAKKAGFDNFIFLSAIDAENNEYRIDLDEWLHPTDKADELPSEFFATKIGFVKSNQKKSSR